MKRRYVWCGECGQPARLLSNFDQVQKLNVKKLYKLVLRTEKWLCDDLHITETRQQIKLDFAGKKI